MNGRRIAERTLLPVGLAALLLAACAPPRAEPTLAEVHAALKRRRLVDLTHPFAPGIPHWPGFPDEERTTLYSYEKGGGTMGSGFLAHRYCHVGQWGTHVDPPAHFVKGLRTIDEIPLDEMILPLVVLDLHERVRRNPDHVVSLADVREWERRHGTIPAGSFVALRTDWSKRWPDAVAMQNRDAKGVAHTPGWSRPVLELLDRERRVTAIGHETTDTDPGLATSRGDYSLERYALSTDHYQVELLTNLDRLPEAGALVIVAFPKPRGGSGFPARVWAVLP